MRILIAVLATCFIALALFLFDDMDQGLLIVNLLVWPTVAVAAAIVWLRRNRHGRMRPRRRRRQLKQPTPGLTTIGAPQVARRLTKH